MRVTCSTHGIFVEVVDPALLDTEIAAHLAADHSDTPEPDIWVVMESESSVENPREAGDLPEKLPSQSGGELLEPEEIEP